jgi:Ion transport protein
MRIVAALSLAPYLSLRSSSSCRASSSCSVRRASQWELTEEIDPRANFVAHGRLLSYAPISLHYFPETSALRQFLVWLITWTWFERVVLVAILLNSLALAVTDYSINAVDLATLQPSGANSPINAFIDSSEGIFTAIFTIEMTCKIIAMGFFMDPGSYLRDGWHVIDFAVVLTSLLQLMPGMPNVSALRAFRVLRPLRALSRAKGMRIMIKSLFAAIPSLLNVGFLLGFAFVLYGILCLNIFTGITHARCRLTPYPVSIPASHLQTWSAPVPGQVPLSSLPWVAAGQYQGFTPEAVAVMTGTASLNSSMLQLINSTSFPAGERQPLYFEAIGRYFTGNEPEESIYEVSVVNQEYYTGNPVAEVPWDVEPQYWMPYPAAANFVFQLVNNRTAFPYCDAGQAVSLGSLQTWPTDTGIPLANKRWNQLTSPWKEPRLCVWIIDSDNRDVCSLSGGGINTCQPPLDFGYDLPSHIPAGSTTANQTLSLRFAPQTCGGNYDAYGNPRFSNARFMDSEDQGDDLENGIVSFDNFGTAMLLLYQNLLQQGWSGILQWYMDAFSLPWVAALIFVSFNLIGALFLLNLVVSYLYFLSSDR